MTDPSARTGRGALGDRAVVVLALSVAAGAWAARPFPVVVAAIAVGAALAARRPWLLCVGATLLASGLGARAWAGLDPPEPGPVRATARLVTDPEPVRDSLRVELAMGGRRVEAYARGAPAAALRPRLAGERVEVGGRLGPVPAGSRAWLAPRHVSARLAVDSVGGWSPGDPASRLANEVRRTLMRGASSLPDERRALFAGLLLGDDRDQSVALEDDFRAAGLSHLTAVSGQNVAFALAVAGPLLRRLGLRLRLVAALGVLLGFGVLTRWEPSVLRAVAMAGLATAAVTLGRPVSTVRLLALAVAGVLLVDPLLVRSVGFLLSAGACSGIAAFARPLAARLPGPRALRSALSVTLAAQVGVTPVLVPVFGGVPVASVPANLLAGPAAGPAMVWGFVGGLPAGLAGQPAAGVLHLPTRLLVGWIAGVAGWAAGLPLGRVGPASAAALVAAWLLARARPAASPLAAAVAVGAVLLPAVGPLGGAPSAAGAQLVRGAALWRAGPAVVVVVDEPDPGRLLDALRARRVRRIDVVVARRGGAAAARALAPVLERVPVGAVVAGPGHRLPGADTVRPGDRVRAGDLVVVVERVAPRLEVRVSGPGGEPP